VESLREIMRSYNITYMTKVNIEKCVDCSECVAICPMQVFELRQGKAVVVNGGDCLGCDSCVEACEPAAITVSEVQKGL
jgi:NAD-dependent dihydropyrimidine dehydrogenase PreA subunit